MTGTTLAGIPKVLQTSGTVWPLAVHPNLFLFTDRPSLLRSHDVFALPWVNGNGKQVRLVP